MVRGSDAITSRPHHRTTPPPAQKLPRALFSSGFSPCRELLKGLLRVFAGPQTGAGAEVAGGEQGGDDDAGAGGERRLADDDGVGPEEGVGRAAGGDAEERGRHGFRVGGVVEEGEEMSIDGLRLLSM